MERFSALLAIYAGNSPVPGEFPAQRQVTRSFDAFFDLHPNQRLSKHSWGWWFETPSRPLWRHCNENQFIRHYGTFEDICACKTISLYREEVMYLFLTLCTVEHKRMITLNSQHVFISRYSIWLVYFHTITRGDMNIRYMAIWVCNLIVENDR